MDPPFNMTVERLQLADADTLTAGSPNNPLTMEMEYTRLPSTIAVPLGDIREMTLPEVCEAFNAAVEEKAVEKYNDLYGQPMTISLETVVRGQETEEGQPGRPGIAVTLPPRVMLTAMGTSSQTKLGNVFHIIRIVRSTRTPGPKVAFVNGSAGPGRFVYEVNSSPKETMQELHTKMNKYMASVAEQERRAAAAAGKEVPAKPEPLPPLKANTYLYLTDLGTTRTEVGDDEHLGPFVHEFTREDLSSKRNAIKVRAALEEGLAHHLLPLSSLRFTKSTEDNDVYVIGGRSRLSRKSEGTITLKFSPALKRRMDLPAESVSLNLAVRDTDAAALPVYLGPPSTEKVEQVFPVMLAVDNARGTSYHSKHGDMALLGEFRKNDAGPTDKCSVLLNEVTGQIEVRMFDSADEPSKTGIALHAKLVIELHRTASQKRKEPYTQQ